MRRLLGWSLIGFGLVINPWLIERLLSTVGLIENFPFFYWLITWDLVVLLTGTGILHWRRLSQYTIFALVFPFLTGFFVLGIVEASSYLVLATVFPETASKAVSAHPFVDFNPTWANLSHPLERENRMPPYPLYGWRYFPKIRDTNRTGPILQTDRDRTMLGFRINHRDDKQALDPEADYRIMMIGGSTVLGWGRRPSHTTPAQLEDILERRMDVNVNVVNTGVPGWFSVNEMAYLMQEVLPFYRPDLVIVLGGYNDSLRAISAGRKFSNQSLDQVPLRDSHLYTPRLEQQYRRWRQWLVNPFFVLNQFLHATQTRFNQRFNVTQTRRYLNLWRYFTGRLVSLMLGGDDPDISDQDDPNNQGSATNSQECQPAPMRVDLYLSNIRSMAGSVHAWNSSFVYALQPAFVYKRPKTDREQKILERTRRAVHAGRSWKTIINRGFWVPYGAGKGSCFDRIQKRFFSRASRGLKELSEKFPSDRMRFVDLSTLFQDRSERIFSDWVHFTQTGHRLIARSLADQVEELLRRKGSHKQ